MTCIIWLMITWLGSHWTSPKIATFLVITKIWLNLLWIFIHRYVRTILYSILYYIIDQHAHYIGRKWRSSGCVAGDFQALIRNITKHATWEWHTLRCGRFYLHAFISSIYLNCPSNNLLLLFSLVPSHAKTFSGICRMESRFRHIGTAGVRLLITYLLSKLELVAVARKQNDWSYNHRLQRMFNSIRLLLKIHEMDISSVIVRTFEVRLCKICCTW